MLKLSNNVKTMKMMKRWKWLIWATSTTEIQLPKQIMRILWCF